MLNDLEKLPIEIIQDYRTKGTSAAIGKALQDYIDQLDRCSELYHTLGNINRAAKKLQEDYPQLPFQTARARVYDSINYFHLNNTVKEEAWYNFYADRLEDLARLNIAKDDLREARLNYIKAHEFRINASKQRIDPALLKPNEVMLSPTLKPEEIGVTEEDLRNMWTDSGKFIDKLPVDDRTKDKLMDEARLALGKYAKEQNEFDDHEEVE